MSNRFLNETPQERRKRRIITTIAIVMVFGGLPRLQHQVIPDLLNQPRTQPPCYMIAAYPYELCGDDDR